METLSPKQLEIKAREKRILEIARPMVVESGYHGMNMDRIAEELETSKGTLYNHFACKEEIVLALAIQAMEKRVGLFRQAAQFRGKSRFRMDAIGVAAEIFVKQYSDYFKFEQILTLGSVLEKTSEKRQSLIRSCELQCMSIVGGIVRDAVANEDLKLDAPLSPEDIVFGLWALTSGGYSIAFSSQSLSQLGLSEPFGLVKRHASALMDGFNWHPLSSTYDLHDLISRIEAEVFNHV